jgi:hypothetical protein
MNSLKFLDVLSFIPKSQVFLYTRKYKKKRYMEFSNLDELILLRNYAFKIKW